MMEVNYKTFKDQEDEMMHIHQLVIIKYIIFDINNNVRKQLYSHKFNINMYK